MSGGVLMNELRAALVDAGYTYDGVAGLLGREAHDALARNETTPGIRRTTGGSPVETLTRLFLLQAPVPRTAAERALTGLLGSLAAEGVVEQTAADVVARLDVRPYAAGERDLWVISDLTPGLDGSSSRVGVDHVLGISAASTSLAQLTIREPVERSLDLGTGCGVQALHLSEHSGHVVATDVNPRALRLARLNADLNAGRNAGAGIELREGSFFAPVEGETFDLITTNPPFVISPATDQRRLVYRDSGLPGDQAVEGIVRAAPAHLVDGGWCQVLANWVITSDEPWEERLGSWLSAECEAFVVQREVIDPAAYVELWLKDAGLHGSAHYLERYDAWLGWFEGLGVEAVGFGWINLRRGPSGTRTFLDWPHPVEQPVAPAILQWGRAIHQDVGLDDTLLRRDDVVQETTGSPGAEDPTTLVLRQQRGLMRARRADTVEAALVGACDGDLSLGQILDALAHLLDRDADELRSTYLPVAAEMVREGYLEAGQ